MLSSTNCWNGLKALLLSLGVLTTIIGLTPTVSYAIPSAGNYSFTSGLTGNFTSDGTQLTVYHIEALYNTWDSTHSWEIVVQNDSTSFTALTDDKAPCLYCGVTLYWPTDHAWVRVGGLSWLDVGQFTYTVPETTSMSLIVLGLGLLVLVDYRGRQRRQAGV